MVTALALLLLWGPTMQTAAADDRSGFRAGMILDSGINRLYSFVFSRPGTPTSGTQCQHQGGAFVYCRAVVQFDTTNFTAGVTGTRMETGLGSITGVS